MDNMINILSGRENDAEVICKFLNEDLIVKAIKIMNEKTLPNQFLIFHDEPIPSNQRNLTDIRTRMGVLLEYELAKAIIEIINDNLGVDIYLSYVIAHKFPDLAFRCKDGIIGLRLEVKAIQTIAEEKSANFDTILKDIRKGSDFVVVLLWEWQDHPSELCRYPKIDSAFVMNAYHLAQMRDCYWLNNPPSNPGNGRQGFDLCFGINCRQGNYNQEEGNYGKMMRIFDKSYQKYLPKEVLECLTLKYYYKFCNETNKLGIKRIAITIAKAFGENINILSENLPVIILIKNGYESFLLVGHEKMPEKVYVKKLMKDYDIYYALIMNKKYDWRVHDNDWNCISRGNKPQQALKWIRENRKN